MEKDTDASAVAGTDTDIGTDTDTDIDGQTHKHPQSTTQNLTHTHHTTPFKNNEPAFGPVFCNWFFGRFVSNYYVFHKLNSKVFKSRVNK